MNIIAASAEESDALIFGDVTEGAGANTAATTISAIVLIISPEFLSAGPRESRSAGVSLRVRC